MKVKDIKEVFFSTHGNLNPTIVWDGKEDLVNGASADYVIKNYGERELLVITADKDKVVLCIK